MKIVHIKMKKEKESKKKKRIVLNSIEKIVKSISSIKSTIEEEYI